MVIAASETLAELLALPEPEFIDGQISIKPMPKFQHSLLQLELPKSIL